VKDHVGVIRSRCDKLDDIFNELNNEILELRSSGRVLADFVHGLGDGRKASERDIPKIKAALRIFGRYT
jgi:hypothetical protein